jgi:CspA family cold shock protein
MGVVKFFTDEKGYGFITPVAGGKDVYVHRNDLLDGVRQLATDQKVSFVIGESDRKVKGDGKKAMQVKVEA